MVEQEPKPIKISTQEGEPKPSIEKETVTAISLDDFAVQVQARNGNIVRARPGGRFIDKSKTEEYGRGRGPMGHYEYFGTYTAETPREIIQFEEVYYKSFGGKANFPQNPFDTSMPSIRALETIVTIENRLKELGTKLPVKTIGPLAEMDEKDKNYHLSVIRSMNLVPYPKKEPSNK